MKKARIIYNEKTDQFEVQYNTGDGWLTQSYYNCVTSAKNPMGMANFISWRILNELSQLENLGYKISFKNLL